MNLEEFKKVLNDELQNNKITEEKLNIETLYKYMIKILEWNKKINLTAIKEEREFITKHFIDSLTISEFIDENSNLIDIGTGAGFPGMPLKIAKPELKITLLDSVGKKINVVKDVVESIEIKDVELIHARVEEIANKENYREQYDYVTSRAVSNLTTLAEYMLPLAKIGGKVICMKGPNFEEEVSQSKNAIRILGGEIQDIITKKISNDYDRTIVIIKKIKNTPKQYPRSNGKPLKEPLY